MAKPKAGFESHSGSRLVFIQSQAGKQTKDEGRPTDRGPASNIRARDALSAAIWRRKTARLRLISSAKAVGMRTTPIWSAH
jgi:hypothetical protein